MIRLLILVEGQSEEIFVKRTLAPYLASRGIQVMSPIVLWTKRHTDGGGFRGGVSNWAQILKSLKPLTQDSNAWVTTLLDFYGLPEDFPGFSVAQQIPDAHERVQTLQAAFSNAVNHKRLIPFLALYEFEAWLFCAPDIVAQHFGNPTLSSKISSAVTHAGQPESINHGAETHPKARLQALGIGYKETSDGPTLMHKIGIDVIRNSCPHFEKWLTRLEHLAAPQQQVGSSSQVA